MQRFQLMKPWFSLVQDFDVTTDEIPSGIEFIHVWLGGSIRAKPTIKML